MIGSGAGSGAKVVIQRVMTTSPRSAMWSLCRWVSSSADRPGGAHADRRRALQHATPAIHQEHLPAGPHQGRRPGAIRVGDGTAGSEQGDLDHGPILASRTACSDRIRVSAVNRGYGH